MSAWATTANALAILQGVGAGFVAGFASGLLGVSSGGILVPAISAVLGVDQHIAQGASLIAQIPPTSLSGVLQYREHGKSVSWRWLIWLSLGFVAGGALGAVCAGGLSDRVLRYCLSAISSCSPCLPFCGALLRRIKPAKRTGPPMQAGRFLSRLAPAAASPPACLASAADSASPPCPLPCCVSGSIARRR